jgi:hypothetical protein
MQDAEKHCSELLSNIKDCLLFCKSNNSLHNFSYNHVEDKIFYPSICANIVKFETSLHATKTVLKFNKPYMLLDTPYKLKYDTLERVLHIHQD